VRGKKPLFLTLILLATVLQLPLAIGDSGWLTGWDQRVKITIDSGDITANLTNFPVLIYLSASSGINSEDITFVFDEVGANSLKIAATTSDGTTECYVEVEKWDSGNEKGWLWVKVSSISSIVDTDIYLYFDNDHADNNAHVGVTNSEVAENVWDANFEFVSHMRDDPDTSHIRDSTTNDVDGTKAGAGQPAVTVNGIIDDAQDFDSGNPDYISMPSTIFEDDTVGCMECWAKRDSAGVIGIPLMSSDEATEANYIGIQWRDDDKIWFQVRLAAGYEFIRETVNSWADTDWHHLAMVQDGIAVKFYVDGALEAAINVIAPNDMGAWFDDVGAILDNVAIGMARILNPVSPFAGLIDEVRISDVVRSGAWIKATYETVNDDLLDYGDEVSLPPAPTELFGAGFNASSPYVSLYWKSNLTDITLFEIQNSTDKVSWEYLGSNTTTEYHDFQVVNGTERYYRVRACRLDGGEWFNSSWSDVDFETVYFILGVGEVSCKIRNYNASSITVIAGTLNDGNLASTFSVDGDWYNVSEINDIPGLDVRFNFTNIGGVPNCGCLDVYHSYTGHPQHDIKIQVWNFTSTSWYQIGTLIYNETAGWECSGLGNYAEHFFHNGSFWGRFYHESQGHVVHEMQIDQIRLDVIYGEECPPCEEVTALLAMGKYYALAIILLILGVLIGIGMRGKR